MKYIDMHCDTISRLYELRQAGKEEHLRENEGRIDLMRMRRGDCLAQNFALYTPLKAVEDPYEYCVALCDLFKEELAQNGDAITQVRSVKDILINDSEGRLSAVLTIEEGGVCRGDTQILRAFYKEGLRMMTLTWNYENELAYPNRLNPATGMCAPELERGLKKKGVEFVELMEELGIIVDVSHLGDAGFWEVLTITKKPFVASHSNARSIAAHPRNMTDEMLRAMAERGGVAGINFGAQFLSNEEWKKEIRLSRVDDMVRNIIHMRNVGGIGCIGLGTDYDGVTCEMELESPAAFSLLSDALLQNGFKESDVEKIFYKNVLRVYGEVWKE